MWRKIYIVSWRGHVSGGGETLHQLCSKANDQGGQASMVYFPLDSSVSDVVPDCFFSYRVGVSQEMLDADDCLCVLSEGLATFFPFHRFHKLRFLFVWLSYDFVSPSLSHRKVLTTGLRYPRASWLLSRAKEYLHHPRSALLERLHFVPWKRIRRSRNFCNCYYAYQQLRKHGVKGTIGRLIGPISDSFEPLQKSNKENEICFGIAKDAGFYKSVIQEFEKEYPATATFVPISGMSRKEVIVALSRAKVYFDFGFFPGPERIPREAVLLGCNILTGTSGASGNRFDVPIPERYKIKAVPKHLSRIVETLHELLINYEIHLPEFEQYRKLVTVQMTVFPEDIRALIAGTANDYVPL